MQINATQTGSDWINRMFVEQQRRAAAATAAKQKREIDQVTLTAKIDSFWASFLDEVRQRAEEYNARANPERQMTISTPEANALALHHKGPNGGQFVARLYKNEERGEVTRWMGRAIQIIDCPIVVREPSTELAIAAENGERYDSTTAARLLLELFFRWTLGLIEEQPPEGERRIGFAH